MDHRSMNCAMYSAKYHIIWCPRYRRRVLVAGIDERLKEIIDPVVPGVRRIEDRGGVMPDHAHPLVEVPPSVPLLELLRRVKGRSSRLLRHEFPRMRGLPRLWTESWFVSTVGGAPLEVVRRDVEN